MVGEDGEWTAARRRRLYLSTAMPRSEEEEGREGSEMRESTTPASEIDWRRG